MKKREAQKELDRVDSELRDLYQKVREREAEREKYDRIANRENLASLKISIGDYS